MPNDAEVKREALVSAAKSLLHEQGVQSTTIAQVAKLARVPVGGVFYHFRTKDALVEAVIASHVAALRERFAGFEAKHAAPLARLNALIRVPLERSERVLELGCPHGSLCAELEKLGESSSLAKAASSMMETYVAWVTAQLRELEVPAKRAGALATQLVAMIQGNMLVANALRSHEVLGENTRLTERWIAAQVTA